MTRHFRRIVLCLLLCAALLGSLPVSAAGAQELQTATLTYRSLTINENVQWDFISSDAWFEADADEYCHPLAQLSLGMAMSAFRTTSGLADANVIDFLTQLGFTELVSEDYNRTPGLETISTVIGHRELSSGETLLVVAVCGQGYQNEWLSNFDVGDQQEHKGFSVSADKVVQRVERYMEAHQINRARLWMSGYSRAAAVSNLTGAKLMKKGLFHEKNAFIYTFATPRTTRAPEPYPNIFNIVGKFDPVTKVPYSEWGYERHGVTLYTPAQETDSDYRFRQARADVPFLKITGMHLWNSTVLNQHLSIIEAYLLSSVQSSAHYASYMTEHIASAWTQPSMDAVVTLLRAMASITADMHAGQEEYQHWTEELVDYILNAALSAKDVGEDTGIEKVGKLPLSASLVIEHNPDVYLAWMFSSADPAEIFSDKTSYIQLVIDGDADVNFFDQKGGFILSVDPEGNVLETTDNEHYNRRIRPVEDRPLLTALTVSGRRMVVVPNDQGFPFTMIPRSATELDYYALYYDVGRCAPRMSAVRSLLMTPGEEYLAFSLTERGQSIMHSDEPLWGDSHAIGRVFDSDHLLSAVDINQVASLNPYRISVRMTVLLLFGFAGILTVGLLALVIGLIIHHRREVERSGKARKAARAIPEDV